MTFKNRAILVILISICFSVLSKSQASNKDTLVTKHEQNIIIGYGNQPAWMVTSAISTINGTELQKSFTSNLANTLYGRLPGLTVTQGSGEAGMDSPNLYVRGLGTYQTGNKLLIIVDGFECFFEQLIPDEIESVTLLKDASATAVYGSRGANGVLLITTKRGEEGPLKVSFSAKQGFENAIRLPNFLGSYDFAQLYNEALINDGNLAQYTSDDLNAYETKNDPIFYPDVNWHDELLRKLAPISNYTLSLNGGHTNSKYFVALNVLNRNGIYKKTADLSDFSIDSKYTQYTVRTNLDLDITKRLSVIFDLGMSISDKANPAGYNTTSVFNLMSLVPPNAFPIYNPNETFGGNALYSNPLGDVLETGFFTSNYRTFQGSFKLIEQLDMITQGLSASACISFNNSFRGYSSKSRTYPRFSISKDAFGNISYNAFGTGTSLSSSESQSDQLRNFTFQTFLNFNRTFDNHQIDAMLGYNLDTYTLSGNSLPYKHVGLSGRLTYANQKKYIGEFSFGYWGSENFPPGNRFGFFPAISIGWIASNEEFLKGSNFINYLKIRGSYGMVGNDNIGGDRFMYAQYYTSTSYYYFGTANTALTGYAEGRILNPDVTWEKAKQGNIGFEAVMLQQLKVGFDFFKQHRYDILSEPNRTVAQFLGMRLPYLNVGKVDNIGFEATISYNSKQDRTLQYFMDASVWYAKNKIVYNAETIQVDEYLNKTGHPVDQPFLLEAIGFFKNQADINASPNQVFADVQPGDIKFKDQNDDGIIDHNDYYPIGKSDIPELTFGLQIGLKYKGFDLNVLFQGVTNRSVYLTGNDFYAFQNNGKIASNALGRWTPETVEQAKYPRLSAQNNLNNYHTSSFWQRDGSFIKLRSIELGYNLSGTAIEKIGLFNARVFINGINLFSLDHINIADPETLTGHPAVRSFSIGVKIEI